QKEAALQRDLVPGFTIEIIDAVGESEAKAAGAMTFLVAAAQGTQGGSDFTKRIGRHGVGHSWFAITRTPLAERDRSPVAARPKYFWHRYASTCALRYWERCDRGADRAPQRPKRIQRAGAAFAVARGACTTGTFKSGNLEWLHLTLNSTG